MMSRDTMNHGRPSRPDHRDALLRDVCLTDDVHGAALPSRMAARVRRRRHLRHAGVACALLVVVAWVALRIAPPLQETPATPVAIAPAVPATSVAPSDPVTLASAPTPTITAIPPAPAILEATDAELLAHLENERVIIFTLADGQRQVVWVDGRPTS